jgi:rubrerythrin
MGSSASRSESIYDNQEPKATHDFEIVEEKVILEGKYTVEMEQNIDRVKIYRRVEDLPEDYRAKLRQLDVTRYKYHPYHSHVGMHFLYYTDDRLYSQGNRWKCEVVNCGYESLEGQMSWHCPLCKFDMCNKCFESQQYTRSS